MDQPALRHGCRLLTAGLVLSTMLLAAPARGQAPPLPPTPEAQGVLTATGTSFELFGMTVETGVSTWVTMLGGDEHCLTFAIDQDPNLPAPLTDVTVGGLAPDTDYFVYQDSFLTTLTLASSDTGTITFPQDLSAPHLVIVQDSEATITIHSLACPAGWTCTPATKPYTAAVAPAGCWLGQTVEVVTDGMLVDLNGCTIEPGNAHGVLVGANAVTVRNGTVAGGYSCVIVDHHDQTVIEDMACVDQPFSGVVLNQTIATTVRTSTLTGALNASGLQVQYATGLLLEGNTATGNRLYGLGVIDATDLTLFSNQFVGNGRGGALIQYADGVASQDNRYGGTAVVDPADLPGWGFGLALMPASAVTSAGDSFDGNDGDGVLVVASSDVTLTDSVVADNGQAGVRVTADALFGGPSTGVTIDGTSSPGTVIGNNAGDGVFFADTCTGTLGPNVDARGNNTGGDPAAADVRVETAPP